MREDPLLSVEGLGPFGLMANDKAESYGDDSNPPHLQGIDVLFQPNCCQRNRHRWQAEREDGCRAESQARVCPVEQEVP